VVVVILLGGLLALNLLAVRSRALRWGKAALEMSDGLVRVTREALDAIKSVKVMHLEGYFTSLLDQKVTGFLSIYVRQNLLPQSPRLILELALVTLVMAGVIIALLFGQSPAEIIPTIVLFAAAAFRMIPTLSRLATQAQILRMTLPALDTLADDIA